MSRLRRFLPAVPALGVFASLILGPVPAQAATAPLAQTFYNSPASTVEGEAQGSNAIWLGNFAGGVLPYTAHVNWGDGSSSIAENYSPDGYGGTYVTGWHTYADEGMAVIVVHLIDAAGSFIDESFSITINDGSLDGFQQQPFSIGKKSTKAVALINSFQDLSSTGRQSDFRAKVTWGDGTSSSCPSQSCWFGPSPSNQQWFALFGSHSYSRTGTFSLTMQVSDIGGFVGPVVQTTGTVTNS